MKVFILIFICFIYLNNCLAQKNLIMAELGGNSLGPSINYQRQIGGKNKLGIRIGIGSAFVNNDHPRGVSSYNISFWSDEKLSIPIATTFLFRFKNQNYFETGLGYTWIDIDKDFQNNEQGTHNLIASLAFVRHFGKGTGWMWKASFTPLLGGISSGAFIFGFSPMAGIAIGKRF